MFAKFFCVIIFINIKRKMYLLRNTLISELRILFLDTQGTLYLKSVLLLGGVRLGLAQEVCQRQHGGAERAARHGPAPLRRAAARPAPHAHHPRHQPQLARQVAAGQLLSPIPILHYRICQTYFQNIPPRSLVLLDRSQGIIHSQVLNHILNIA